MQLQNDIASFRSDVTKEVRTMVLLATGQLHHF